jgi:porphobilinogen synthase
MFPNIRLRRNRSHSWMRDIVAENYLIPSNLIMPLFVIEGSGIREEIPSMEGVFRLSIDELVKEAKLAASIGIKAIMLFPYVNQNLKTKLAEESYNENNLIIRAIKTLKDSGINIGVIADVALDPYTTDGHDGIVINNKVHNDATIEILEKQSLSLAKAGVDMIAPSDMMDGRIGRIREFLDNHSFIDLGIISYSAKYSSAFFSPFRDAIGSKNNLGKADKKTYQMDIRNSKEAIREIELDIKEGADAIIIKPAITSLDIISNAHKEFKIPIFAYQVSGEYSVLKNAAKNNIIDFKSSLFESLYCIKRAGVSAIITYAAVEVAKTIIEDKLY